MGYADGYYYGQGRIICDTSTFSVGDTIRVRSMTDTSKVWNQQVATVGTVLVFTVPCYDYYKICTVQTINDTPTEIGGVYKTVDYGQTLFINVLDKTTLGGIQGILNAHQEGDILAIGDEVPIIHGGNPWIMQVGDIDTTNHAVHFVSKVLYSKAQSNSDYRSSGLRSAIQGFYTDISSEDKQYIKQVTRTANTTYTYTDYIWCLGIREVDGVNGLSSQHQFPIFLTQANRIKTLNGSAVHWWTADYTGGGSYNFAVLSNGVTSQEIWSNSYGVLPCFTLTADS